MHDIFVDSLIGTDFSPALHICQNIPIVRILCCDEHPSQLTRSLPRLNENKEGIKLQYLVHQFIQDVAGNEIFKDAENAHLSRVSCVLLH